MHRAIFQLAIWRTLLVDLFHGVCMGGWEKQGIGTIVLPCVGLFAAAQATLCAIANCDGLTLCVLP